MNRHPHPDVEEWPKTLYHYTNAAGLLGILEGRYLRATDARFLNDSGEVEFGIAVIRDFIDNPPHGISAEKQPIIADLRARYQTIRAAVEGLEANLYTVSFSSDRNDLSQWRAYGSPDVGYAIGIRTFALNVMEIPGSALRGILGRVSYEPEEQRNLLLDDVNACEFEEIDVDQALSLYLGLRLRSLFFKAAAFAVEREWRAVTLLPLKEASAAIGLATSKLGIVPYIRMTIVGSDQWGAGIDEVVIGPVEHPAEAQDAVRVALTLHGYPLDEVELTNSGIAYRLVR